MGQNVNENKAMTKVVILSHGATANLSLSLSHMVQPQTYCI